MSQETHQSLMDLFNTYVTEHEKFVDKGVKASAARARKALSEISKAVKTRRAEIQETKNSLSAPSEK